MGFRDSAQQLAGLGMERIEEDLFDVAFDIVVSIHAAAPLGRTDVDPVCGPIAGT
jgi:hypothetical protein